MYTLSKLTDTVERQTRRQYLCDFIFGARPFTPVRPYMSNNKRKRSRIVSSTPDPLSASHSTDTLTTTCTNNNSRRLAAYSVTLRTSTNHRQTQFVAQTEVSSSDHSVQAATLLDGEPVADAAGEEQMDMAADDNGEDEGADGPKRPPVRVKFRPTTSISELENSQNRPCQEWLPYRKEYLDELLRHDALGTLDQPLACSTCNMHDGTIKCLDCHSGTLQCTSCTVISHSHLVLHRIEVCTRTIIHCQINKLM